jgi:hypothetical protein
MLALGTAFLWLAVKVRDLVQHEPRATAELEPAPQPVELRVA